MVPEEVQKCQPLLLDSLVVPEEVQKCQPLHSKRGDPLQDQENAQDPAQGSELVELDEPNCSKQLCQVAFPGDELFLEPPRHEYAHLQHAPNWIHEQPSKQKLGCGRHRSCGALWRRPMPGHASEWGQVCFPPVSSSRSNRQGWRPHVQTVAWQEVHV